MAGNITQGIRVMPNDQGWLEPVEINKPARYGRVTNERGQSGRVGWWQVTSPTGSMGCLNPELHKVSEHEDGTITVEPSIVFSDWHGWLRRGVFESV